MHGTRGPPSGPCTAHGGVQCLRLLCSRQGKAAHAAKFARRTRESRGAESVRADARNAVAVVAVVVVAVVVVVVVGQLSLVDAPVSSVAYPQHHGNEQRCSKGPRERPALDVRVAPLEAVMQLSSREPGHQGRRGASGISAITREAVVRSSVFAIAMIAGDCSDS